MTDEEMNLKYLNLRGVFDLCEQMRRELQGASELFLKRESVAQGPETFARKMDAIIRLEEEVSEIIQGSKQIIQNIWDGDYAGGKSK